MRCSSPVSLRLHRGDHRRHHQVDLPKAQSGLAHVIEVLDGVPGITSPFKPKDVVRHPLVQRIVEAYERFERRRRAAEGRRGDA